MALSRLSAGVLLTALLLAITATVGAAEIASEGGFEIEVSVSTIVKATEGSETVLAEQAVPSDLVGELCSVIARSVNQSSVHPGNDLIVESASAVVLEDVEAVPGGTVTASDTMVLNDSVSITLVMGPDEVFSAGIDVLLDCPPETTTTTAPPVTTTTVVDSTTTTAIDTTTTLPPATTTTIIGSSTTTVVDSTTTTSDTPTTTPPGGGPTTTVPEVTTTTVPDEVLVHTGPPDRRLFLLAIAMVASGGLLLAGERRPGIAGLGFMGRFRRRCQECGLEAEFMTPHGRLCKLHTRKALDKDDVLWMPSKLNPRKS